MERWRWLPVNLGSFYVMNNIPEFTSEIWKGNELELKQKMIDGQPAWPTPVLAASMQSIVFHPDWGMPDGIKMKELLPRLRQSIQQRFRLLRSVIRRRRERRRARARSLQTASLVERPSGRSKFGRLE